MLGKIIHPLQGAFVPERLTKDDVLQAHENFQFLKLKKGIEGWVVIKLDMGKRLWPVRMEIERP